MVSAMPLPAVSVVHVPFTREISMFFQGRSEVHKTMRRLTRRLDRAGIVYAVVGGMAVHAQGYRRTTDDMDVLLTANGFVDFKERFVPKFYLPTERKRRFIDRVNQVTLDVLVTGFFPGSGKPGPVAYPDPGHVREIIDRIYVLNLASLIQLKLAAQRHQDFADVVNLIRAHDLDESYQANLHATLHRDFIECLEEKRREDEYEARDRE